MASMTPMSRALLRQTLAARRPLVSHAARAFSMAPARFSDEKTPGELGVGELQGAKFRIEPLRRVGEDIETKRARLVCTSFDRPHTLSLYFAENSLANRLLVATVRPIPQAGNPRV
jgi:hypothetical protein